MAARENIERIERTSKDLPSLIEQLAGDVGRLVDQKVTLLKLEIKEEVQAYVRGSIAILAGAIVAAVGFALANTALAFAISTFFANTTLSQPARYAVGFVITGALYLVVGVTAILFAKNRLTKQGIIPQRTVQELEKDKEWLQREI
jgi:uncharacterized membrane protein YqjE